MKKVLPILFFSPLLLLSGCNGEIDRIDPVSIVYGTHVGMEKEFKENSHLSEIDAATLASKVENKENFILVAHSNALIDCTCYSDWHNEVLAPYIKKNNLLVYLIDLSEVSGSGKSSYGLSLNAQHATLAIFEEGKIKYQKTTEGDNNPWASSYNEFAAWMNYRIKKPSMFFISLDELNEKYAGTAEFTIYFDRDTCPDCGYFNTHYLKQYLSENDNLSPSYILDCDEVGIRYAKGEDGKVYAPSNSDEASEYEKQAYAQWMKFRQDYGLAYAEDNPAGWDNGYVPTLYHINPKGDGSKKGDVIDGAMVIYNDMVENQAISTSYFTAERLELEALAYLKESKEIKDEDKVLLGKSVGEQGDRRSGVYRREETSIYHDPIAKAFLDEFIGN